MQDPAPQDQGEGTWTPNKGVSMFYKAVKMGYIAVGIFKDTIYHVLHSNQE